MALLRLFSAVGGGAVLYLTPMVFHREAFTASAVGEGLALAALVGAGGRVVSGLLLDRGLSCSWPIALGVVASLLGDVVLLNATTSGPYRVGQALVGLAMGLYWPAIELAVPLSCAPVPSARAYALARTADALGVATGALAGALLAARGWLRGIYVLDLGVLLSMALLLWRSPLPGQARPPAVSVEGSARRALAGVRSAWLMPLLPLLGLVVLATAVPALMQSALPLDLVRGGLRRPPLRESLGALTIGLQLALLMLLQWPIGRALARRPVARGLAFSLVAFAAGTLLLAASALVPWGGWLLVAAQGPLAIGAAAFLPTATEAVVEITPVAHRGLALAFFSQCFALSGLTAPLLGGWLLDRQGHGAGLWLATSGALLLGLPLAARLRPARQLSDAAGASGG
ncbi:MAG: MFS transporter [Cyanobacteriota bacterium]|nr:MFS transporter [Cyanobacteriota bacterium]